MRDARRDVEDIAGLQHPFLGRLKCAQQFQILMRQQRRIGIAMRPDLPMTAAKPLDQENIILVEMRPDPALVCGEADHHIVDAPIGNETKRRDQICNGGDMMVHRLHQQRPMAFA